MGVQHERPQSGPIRPHPPRRTSSVNLHIHRIVPKGARQDVEQFATRARVGIWVGVLYHASTMLPRSRRSRVHEMPHRIQPESVLTDATLATRGAASPDLGTVYPDMVFETP